MSEARRLTGREPARELRKELRGRVESLASPRRPLTLSVLHVGDDEAAAAYTRRILRSCRNVGVVGSVEALDGGANTQEVVERVTALGQSDAFDGLIVQMPLPEGIDAKAVTEAISPAKDVDRVTSTALGELFRGSTRLAPATATAVERLLDFYAVDLEGRHAVVVGRSNIVGKPVAVLLLGRHATVTLCHSRTRDLPGVARQGDILVVAVGRKHLVDDSYVKSGAVVVDVGTNYEGGTVYGDVDSAAARVASALSPVPGGVGPLTTYCLLQNLVRLVEQARA